MQPNVTNNSASPAYAWQRWGYVSVGVFFFVGNLEVIPLWEISEGAPRYDVFCAVWTLLWLGVIVAQLLLLAIYGVWGVGPYYVRLLGTIAAGVVLVAALWLGDVTCTPLGRTYSTMPLSKLLEAAIPIPTLMLVTQCPLWFLRWFLGWRLIHKGTERPPRRWTQFSIADLMTITLVVALAVPSGQWVFFVLTRIDEPDSFKLMLVGIFLGCPLVIVLLTVVPMLWGIFRPANLVGSLSGLAIYGVFMGTIVTVLALMGSGDEPLRPIFFLAPFLGLTLGLVLPLFIAWSQGYRLIWGRETEYPQASAENATEEKTSG